MESDAVTAVWNNLLEVDLPPEDLSNGILITGSTKIEAEDLDGPGNSCLRGAFAEMSMLYVMRATESDTSKVKNKLPQPIFCDRIQE